MCNTYSLRVPHLCKVGMNIFVSTQDDLEESINVEKEMQRNSRICPVGSQRCDFPYTNYKDSKIGKTFL